MGGSRPPPLLRSDGPRDIPTDSTYVSRMSSIARDLAELLSTVQRPGDFFVTGTAEFRAPVLDVEGVGRLALPPRRNPLLMAAAKRRSSIQRCAVAGRSAPSLFASADAVGERRWRQSWPASPMAL